MRYLVLKSWLLALLLLAGAGAWAQAPTWQDAFLAGGGAYSRVEAMATDAAGNVYVTGSFSNATLVLGNFTLTNAIVSTQTGGSSDFFLAKWSPVTRTFVWAVRAGGISGGDGGESLAVSGNSVYVTAGLNGSGFGGAAVPAGIYLAKFTDTGTLVWSAPAGGLNSGSRILVAGSSGLYVVAGFTGTASFGATTLTSAGGQDIVVARLLDTGSTFSYAWALRAGGPGADTATAFTVLGSTLYLTASTDGSATFGASTTGNTFAACVARLTDAGNSGSFDWVQSVAGTRFYTLAASSGSVYVGGSTNYAVTIGSTALATGSYFLAHLTDAATTGSFTWAWQTAPVNSTTGPVTIDALAATSRYVYLSGYLGATATFGPNTLVPSQAGFSYAGLFVARLTLGSPPGVFDWGVAPSSSFYALSYPAKMSVAGTTVHVAGMMAGPATFGGLMSPASGGPVAFLAALRDNAALPTRAATNLPGLFIFPNPTHGAATVRVPAGAGLATVQVLDALGQVVRQAPAVAGQDYALSGLTPGLYAVRVQVGEASATRQLTVE